MFGLNHLCKTYFEAIGNFILKPFVFNHQVELLMVMIVFPLIFNAIQFWVFDEILKFNVNPESDRNLLNAQIIDDDSESNTNPSEQIAELGTIQTPPQRILSPNTTSTDIPPINELKLEENPSGIDNTNKDNSLITNSTEVSKEEVKDDSLPSNEDLATQLGDYNAQVVDILHYIEFSHLDACSGYLTFKKLQDVLIARRTVKEQMEIINKLENCGLIAEKINAANNQAKKILEESRSYCPRSNIDIFD